MFTSSHPLKERRSCRKACARETLLPSPASFLFRKASNPNPRASPNPNGVPWHSVPVENRAGQGSRKSSGLHWKFYDRLFPSNSKPTHFLKKLYVLVTRENMLAIFFKYIFISKWIYIINFLSHDLIMKIVQKSFFLHMDVICSKHAWCMYKYFKILYPTYTCIIHILNTHNIHMQKTQIHKIINFIWILNKPMKLVNLWYMCKT
jgi:hypothetical protein